MKKMHLIGAVAAAAIAGQFALTSLASADPAKPDRAQRVAAMCTDMAARSAAKLTYLETKLAPTAAQKSAWDNYKTAITNDAKANETKCLERVKDFKKDGKRPTILERHAMQEKMLEARLASLKAQEAPLTALYAKLSDEQKLVMDRSGRFGMGHGGKRHHKHGEHHDHGKDKPANAPVEN